MGRAMVQTYACGARCSVWPDVDAEKALAFFAEHCRDMTPGLVLVFAAAASDPDAIADEEKSEPAPVLAAVPSEPVAEAPTEKAPAPAARPTRGSASEPAVEPPAEPLEDSPKVVSIDAFRKKNT